MIFELRGDKLVSETFSWESEDNTLAIEFDITSMLAAIAMNEVPYEKLVTLVDANFVRNWIIPHRELSASRLDEIMSDPELLDKPVLGVWMPMDDNTVLLIDGSHRYAARFVKHKLDVRYHVLAYEDWKPFATVTKGTLP